jgi:hypothetical protein
MDAVIDDMLYTSRLPTCSTELTTAVVMPQIIVGAVQICPPERPISIHQPSLLACREHGDGT